MNFSGSTSQRRFLFVLGVFWAPILFFIVAEECVFYRSGETWTIERVIRNQRDDPNSLFMRRLFDQQFYLYKMKEIICRNPQVVALGSSRVMEFRADMFGADAKEFYNAGGLLECVEQLTLAIHQMPNFKPRVVILGIDMWWFNDNWDRTNLQNIDSSFLRATDAARSWEAHLLALRRFWLKQGNALNLWKSYLAIVSGPKQGRLGLAAQLDECGFRGSDGSYAFPSPATPSEHWVERMSAFHLERIAREDMQFLPTPRISNRLLKEFRDDILELKNRGVLVVGFLPPFSSDIVRALDLSQHQRELWRQYAKEVPALFTELDLPCIDASTAASLGLDDRYMRDGVHAMETFHLHLLQTMLNDSRVESALPSARSCIQRALTSRHTDFWHADFSATDTQQANVGLSHAGIGTHPLTVSAKQK